LRRVRAVRKRETRYSLVPEHVILVVTVIDWITMKDGVNK